MLFDSQMPLWWGYVHTNGSTHLKRYFDKRDIEEAQQSPFVEKLIHLFEAPDRESALIQLEKEVNGK